MSVNVLLTCVGRRHYLASFFCQELGSSGKLIGVDMDSSAPALQACHKYYQVPSVFDPSYLEHIKKIVVDESIDIVFSLNDLEIGLLSQNRDVLERETGATFFVPPQSTFSICSDKWLTYQYALASNIPVPATFLSISDAERALSSGNLSFPVIVKPRWGSSSIGIYKSNCYDDLTSLYQSCQDSVDQGLLSSFGIDQSVVIQEYIEGIEYGVDILYDSNHSFIGYAAKKKISMRAGETDKAITVDPKPFTHLIKTITSSLPHRGNMDCDLLVQNDIPYLLEFNPRFGGGYPFTHMSGANHIRHLLNRFLSLEPTLYSYSIDKAFSKCDFLVDVT